MHQLKVYAFTSGLLSEQPSTLSEQSSTPSEQPSTPSEQSSAFHEQSSTAQVFYFTLLNKHFLLTAL